MKPSKTIEELDRIVDFVGKIAIATLAIYILSWTWTILDEIPF